MRTPSVLLSSIAAAALSALGAASEPNASQPLSSKLILPATFSPPQVFKHANLVRTTNLDKGFVRETINAVVENTDKASQSEYFLPFPADVLPRIGALEARDKKEPEKDPFAAEVVEFDAQRSSCLPQNARRRADRASPTQFYRITLPPLAPGAQLTLSISYSILSALEPVPAQIGQADKQYLRYVFSAYVPTAYATDKQKTKVKLPSGDVPDYTTLPAALNTDGAEDPQRQGATFTYGPYAAVPPGAVQPVAVRYEFTKPLVCATRLERDVEVSHWGGNLAAEERFWLVHRGAALRDHFSRLQWQQQAYVQAPNAALNSLTFPLRPSASDPYFIDDIGNVSTSRFRASPREAHLELKPRYPIFGGWKYSFRVGWDADLAHYLRRLGPERFVLKVPFFEGPRQSEGAQYETVVLRVILPEGATYDSCCLGVSC